MKDNNHSLNIVYLNSIGKGPSGGIKTLYYHSEIINKLNIKNITSEILHIKKRKISKWNTSVRKLFNISSEREKLGKDDFGWQAENITIDKESKPKWYKNNIKLKKNFTFRKDKDFVIFPEILAHLAKKL